MSSGFDFGVPLMENILPPLVVTSLYYYMSSMVVIICNVCTDSLGNADRLRIIVLARTWWYTNDIQWVLLYDVPLTVSAVPPSGVVLISLRLCC